MPTDSEPEDFLKRPLADIIEEVKRLRAEKTFLTASNNDLRRKISAQPLVPDLYASQLVETKSFLRTVVQRYGLQLPSLPPEILLAIFRFTQPPGPPYYHQPSISHGPRNPWLDSLKTKKALVLVCKAWSAPATELLYSDIVLRRMGQISALANTFRGDRKPNLSDLVRTVRVDMCVVLTHCTDVVRKDFEYILAQCRMLLSFAYIPHPQFDFQSYSFACGGATPTTPTAFNPTWMLDLRHGRVGDLLARSLNARLMTLHLELTTYKGSFGPLTHLLSSARCLASLKLGSMSPQPIYFPSDVLSDLPDLLFPALKTLSIYCDFPPFIRYVAAQWTMPHLATLTCMDADRIPIPFLEAHAKQLTYLHFMDTDTPHDLEANTTLLPRLHQLCPRILHLALAIVPQERTALNIHSPTLRYLDICARPSVTTYRAIALAPATRTPQLAKVRMVADAYDFIPQYFHPAHMPGSDRALEDISGIPGVHEESDDLANWLVSTTGGITARFPGWPMRQHSWAVMVDELGFLDEDEDDDDDEDETASEGEYEYESLPSSPADSDTASGEEDDCEMGDVRARGAGDDHSDSDMERGWSKVENPGPPVSPSFTFVDDLLDSSRRRYDRETVLRRFSRSQLGDFLLE